MSVLEQKAYGAMPFTAIYRIIILSIRYASITVEIFLLWCNMQCHVCLIQYNVCFQLCAVYDSSIIYAYTVKAQCQSAVVTGGGVPVLCCLCICVHVYMCTCVSSRSVLLTLMGTPLLLLQGASAIVQVALGTYLS